MEDKDFEFVIFNGDTNYKMFNISKARVQISKLYLEERDNDIHRNIAFEGNQEAIIQMYGRIPRFRLKKYIVNALTNYAHPLTVTKLRLLGVL